jgi:hypothetical protein
MGTERYPAWGPAFSSHLHSQDGEFQVEPHCVEDDLWHAVARVNQFECALRS